MNADKGPYTSPSVVQPWMNSIPFKMQATLLSITRGCDGIPKNDISKRITRVLRGTFLRPAMKNPTSFYEPPTVDIPMLIHDFLANCDHYPLHFIQHLMMAIEIVGYKHPDSRVRTLWLGFYTKLCLNIHVRPETEPDMDSRLADDLKWTPHS